MKILAISGGTKNGNNDSICKEALMTAQKLGAEIEFIRLLDLDLKHCTGCGFCMKSLNMGQGGGCTLKDDFAWLRDKILDADGVLFSIPVFEKGAAGVFHTVLDRFGPGNDYGTNYLARQTARENGGKEPDPRIFHKKAVAFLGTGGTDYVTRFQCDCAMLATVMMWDVVTCEVFDWITCFEMEDNRIQRVQEVAATLTNAAGTDKAAPYIGEMGVCPHCQCNNFYLQKDGRAECCRCGIKGRIEVDESGLRFCFPEEQLSLAYDTLEGKLDHAAQIKANQARRMEIRKTEQFLQRKDAYRAFLQPSVPQRNQ